MGRIAGGGLPEDEPSPVAGIVVDVDDLGSFRELLSRELLHNLGPAGRKVIAEHTHGPGFGWETISEQVRAIRERYAQALTTSINNMSVYIRFAEALIDGITEIQRNYESTELDAQTLTAILMSKIRPTTNWDPNAPRGMSM